MKPRYALAAVATLLAAGAASAQYIPATYQEPYCREFTKVVTIGGRAQNAYGQACQQADGSWEIVSDDIPTNQPVQYNPESNAVIYQPVAQPVAYYPPQTYYEPTYYRPQTVFSLSFSNWNPRRMNYYNDYSHGWRDNDRGHRGGRDWNRGHGRGDNDHGNRGGRGDGRGRGHDRH